MSTFLSKISLFCCLVAVMAMPAGALGQTSDGTTQSTPTAEEQQKMLTAMRQYAEDYISNLPNFICVQTTQQFESGRKAEHWHKGDTLTSKLVFNQGREERNLELVNDKPVKPGTRRWHTPLTTNGEFGILLSNVFGTASDASFQWNSRQELQGKELAVFDYSIDREHSTMTLGLSDLAHATVAYHGSIYADPATGVVWRITNMASDIPPQVQTKSISTTIDYGEISIGGASYVLPVKATVLMTIPSNNIRNEYSFSGYRKFEAESTITFTPAGGSGPQKQNSSRNPPSQ